MTQKVVGELLRRRIGLDPTSTGPGLVTRAVRARMSAQRLPESDTATYLRLLGDSEEEVQALIEEAVVPESWFLRDEHPFALLADRAEALGRGEGPAPTLRALSLPCARGEEPYSIALTLLDRGWPPARFRVDAVDVSRALIESARRGVYGGNSFRSATWASATATSVRPNAGYEVAPEVRSAVTFHVGNLLDPGLLADRPPYDVIFCRNLLIYLDGPARLRASANLDRLLAPSGLLFLGHAEQLGPLGDAFRPTGPARCFAFERASGPPAARSPRRAGPPALRSPARPPAVVTRRAPPPAPRATPPPPAPAPAPAPLPPPPLDEASRLADLGRHAEADALCEQEIRRAGPSAAAYFLLGVVRQAAGSRDQAERCFEKAVYLDPSHADSLLALALLAQRRGDTDSAANFRRRASRASQETTPR